MKLEIFVDFFQGLYTLKNVDSEQIMAFLDNLLFSRLSEEHVAMLETLIGQDEIMEATNALKANIALGLDGFTSKIYKKFRDSLLPYLNDLFAACKKSSLPVSWARARITLLPSKERIYHYSSHIGSSLCLM